MKLVATIAFAFACGHAPVGPPPAASPTAASTLSATAASSEDAPANPPERIVTGAVEAIRFLSANRLLTIARGELAIWDFGAAKKLRTHALEPALLVAVSADGTRVATLREADLRTMSLEVARFDGGAPLAKRTDPRIELDYSEHLSFLADGRVAAGRSWTKATKALDACIRMYSPTLSPAAKLCPKEPADKSLFSADGKLVARIPMPTDTTLRMLDTATLHEVATFTVEAGGTVAAAFAQRSDRFAYVDRKEVVVLRTDSWRVEARTRTDVYSPSLAFEGDQLFIVGPDRASRWDLSVPAPTELAWKPVTNRQAWAPLPGGDKILYLDGDALVVSPRLD